MLTEALIKQVADLRQKGLHRQRKLAPSCEGVNFSSSDYLSLAQEPCLRKAFQKGFANHPSGSGGSMVICGYHASHRDLERAFSDALKVDDALLFTSGYAANLGIVALLAQLNAQIIIDKGAHASFYDGLRQNGCAYSRFLHNNFNHLISILKSKILNPAVITESVFSMSGQATNLSQLSAICNDFNADSLVDEAHAFGVLGKEGLGAVVQHGLNQDQIPLRIIPFGKAFAFQGAIVAGRGEWIDALLQFARSHTYSTAISPAIAYGLLETLAFIRASDERRQKLSNLIQYFQNHCANSSLKWRISSTAIQQLQLGCPHKALLCTKYLHSEGIFCQAMREPTVNRKDTGLRVILNYHHEPEDIDNLFAKIHQFAALELQDESSY